MIHRRFRAALLALPMISLCLLHPGGAHAASIYSAVGDFSATNNPNGPWTYGYETTLGGTFSTLAFADSAHGLDAWATNANYPGGDATPYIAHNPSGSTITYTSFSVPADELQLQPGPQGEYAVVRWISPYLSATTLTISGHFSSEDNHVTPDPAGTSSDAHVLFNGVSLLDTNIDGIGVVSPFSLTVQVGAGDTIDFAVGYGSNLDYSFDSTGLQAVLSETPEPTTLVLMVSVLAAMMLARRSLSRT
jgi:hypothetical protein